MHMIGQTPKVAPSDAGGVAGESVWPKDRTGVLRLGAPVRHVSRDEVKGGPDGWDAEG